MAGLTPIGFGVHRLDMPIPIPGLRQVNLWFLEDDDGWTLVDCGYPGPDNQLLLQQAWRALRRRGPIRRLIITHHHTDHIGNAGWLETRFPGLNVLMPSPEWERMTDALTEDPTSEESRVRRRRYLTEQGLPVEAVERLLRRPHRYAELIDPPLTVQFLANGQEIAIGGKDWEVIATPGHSVGMITLFCRETGIYLSADHVLPGITPNIAVWDRDDWLLNPLDDFLSSLARVRNVISDDVLVLPSHRDPFRGLHRRIAELEDHHARRLRAVVDLVQETGSVTPVQCLPRLFDRSIDEGSMGFAVAEALAHLNYLVHDGVLDTQPDESGARRYLSRRAARRRLP